MALTTAGIIGAAGLAAASGIGSSIGAAALGKRASDYAAQKAADAQEAVNAEQIKFAREQNEITRQREDNAHQREVADLQAAGLSPLASTSGASAANGLNADLSAEGFTRAAELQANGATNLARSFDVSSHLNQALGNYVQLQDQQTRQSVGNAQAGLMDSQKNQYDINNSTLFTHNIFELARLGKEIEHMDIENDKDRVWRDNMKDYVHSLISQNFANASAHNAQAARTLGQEKRDQSWSKFLSDSNLPPNTTMSLNLSGPFGISGLHSYINSKLQGNFNYENGEPATPWYRKPMFGENGVLKLPGQLQNLIGAQADKASQEAELQEAAMLKELDAAIEREKQELRKNNRLSSSTLETLQAARERYKKTGKLFDDE